MKEREIYADLRCVSPVILRVDGRNFQRALKKEGFEKPYDFFFATCMANSIELFFKKSNMNPVFAYTFSDEASLVFADLPFDRRVEKLDSVVPSFLSSAFTLFSGIEEPVAFDCRVIPVCNDQFTEYMQWRQQEAWRNFVSSYGYYTLIDEGIDKKSVASVMHGKKSQDIHEMMFERGTNLAKKPVWQRRGVAVYREKYPIEGYNPLLEEKTQSTRTRISQDWDLPLFSTAEGDNFLKRHISLD
ncbi:MAG: tRNA(His) guanylyltransferase Thg1 family protein [Methanohalophilus sp.]